MTTLPQGAFIRGNFESALGAAIDKIVDMVVKLKTPLTAAPLDATPSKTSPSTELMELMGAMEKQCSYYPLYIIGGCIHL